MRRFEMLAALALLTGVSAAAVDPTGDEFGASAGSDLIAISACQSATMLTIRLDFAGPIVPPPGIATNVIYGAIDIDVDRNAVTGVGSRTDDSNPGGALSGLGVELIVELFNYDAETGTTTLRDTFSAEQSDVPVVFETQSLTVTIPLPRDQAPSGVDLAAVVGNVDEPTDVAPNTGSVTAPSCCANGQLDAGEDCDVASECCNDACLFADGAQCGGDVCSERGTCAAGTCEGAGAPRDCDDGDPCFDDTCEAPGGCAHTDRIGMPGAACAFERALPTACAGVTVGTAGLDKAGGFVTKAFAASAKKHKALLRKARKGVVKFGKQIGKLARKEKIPADCAGGLQGQANDAVRRIEIVLAGG
jgi:hypothetical protein